MQVCGLGWLWAGLDQAGLAGGCGCGLAGLASGPGRAGIGGGGPLPLEKGEPSILESGSYIYIYIYTSRCSYIQREIFVGFGISVALKCPALCLAL